MEGAGTGGPGSADPEPPGYCHRMQGACGLGPSWFAVFPSFSVAQASSTGEGRSPAGPCPGHTTRAVVNPVLHAPSPRSVAGGSGLSAPGPPSWGRSGFLLGKDEEGSQWPPSSEPPPAPGQMRSELEASLCRESLGAPSVRTNLKPQPGEVWLPHRTHKSWLFEVSRPWLRGWFPGTCGPVPGRLWPRIPQPCLVTTGPSPSLVTCGRDPRGS